MNKEVPCHRKQVVYGLRCCALARHVRLVNLSSNAEPKPVRTLWCKPEGSCLLHFPQTSLGSASYV